MISAFLKGLKYRGDIYLKYHGDIYPNAFLSIGILSAFTNKEVDDKLIAAGGLCSLCSI